MDCGHSRLSASFGDSALNRQDSRCTTAWATTTSDMGAPQAFQQRIIRRGLLILRGGEPCTSDDEPIMNQCHRPCHGRGDQFVPHEQ
jgi:hypothetical protein